MSYKLDDIYNKYLSEIEKQYNIYKEAQTNPELILTKMFDSAERQPYYNHMHYILKNAGIRFHDFQKILFHSLRGYFYELDNSVELELNYGSRIYFIKYMEVKKRGE